MGANKIVINVPSTVFQVLEIARHELDAFNMVCTAFLRYTAPVLGGPEPTDGNHISSVGLGIHQKNSNRFSGRGSARSRTLS